MKSFSWLLVVGTFLLVGCSLKPPNDPICYVDAPMEANCTFMVDGTDFKVDDSGHNYTLNGHNWNYDQIVQNFLLVPPETYGDIKTFFLNYCHDNPNVCDYQTMQSTFQEYESRFQDYAY